MRKALVALGIVLVFAGVIVASVSVTATEKPPYTTTITTAQNQWEVGPGRFKKGEKLLVYFFPPPDLERYPDPSAKISVEITGPRGGKTVFLVNFSRQFGKSVPPEFYLISNEDGLTVSNPPNELGGFVRYTGDYWANITTRRLWDVPRTLELSLEIVDKEHPYLFVLPMGIALIVVGGCLSIWGAKSSKRRVRSRVKEPLTKTSASHASPIRF